MSNISIRAQCLLYLIVLIESRVIGLISTFTEYKQVTAFFTNVSEADPAPLTTCSYSNIFSKWTDHVVEEPGAK